MPQTLVTVIILGGLICFGNIVKKSLDQDMTRIVIKVGGERKRERESERASRYK